MATVVQPPQFGAPSSAPNVVPMPDFSNVISGGGSFESRGPNFENVVSGGSSLQMMPNVAPMPDFSVPHTADMQDWGDIQWSRAKRFASTLGENFADVFTETLPTTISEGGNQLGMGAGLLLGTSPYGPVKELGKAIAGATMEWQNRNENEMLAAAKERQATMQSGPQGFTDDVLNTTAASLGKMGAHLILGAGMPLPTLAAMYVDSAKEKELELLAEGKTRTEAERFGAIDGLIEAGTEYYGLKLGTKLVSEVLKPTSPVLKKFAQYMAAEWGGEQVATVLGAANDAIAKEKTWDEFTTDLKRQMPVSLVAPVATGALQLGAIKGAKMTAGVALDFMIKREEANAPAEFTPLNKNYLKVRDFLYGVKQELVGLQEEEANLSQQIGALPGLDAQNPLPADAQLMGQAAMAAASTPGAVVDLKVAEDTGRLDLQHWQRLNPSDPFIQSLILQRGPNGEDLKNAPGVDYLHGDKYRPGLYLGNTSEVNARETAAREEYLEGRLMGKLPGTFEYKQAQVENQLHRKEAKVRREMVDEIAAQVEDWRKKYLPDHAFVLSFDRTTNMPGTLGTALTINKKRSATDPVGQNVSFINLNMEKIIAQKFKVKSNALGVGSRIAGPTRNDLARTMEVVAHEFGHTLATHWERTLGPKEMGILRRAFLDDVLKYSARRQAGRQQKQTAATVEERIQGAQREVGSDSMIESPAKASQMAYTRNAHANAGQAIPSERFWGNWGTYVEWLAHQMGKTWRYQQGKETPVDTIMRPIRRAMEHFWRKNRDKWMPNSTYEMFLNRAMLTNRIDSLQEKRLKAEAAFIKAVKNMKAKPPETVMVDRFGNLLRGGKGGKGKPPGGSWLGPKFIRDQQEKMTTFNKVIKLTSGLLHLAEINNHIPGLLRSDRENGESYVQLQYKQNAIQNGWKERAYVIARGLVKAMPLKGGKDWIRRFDSFIFEADSLSSKLERKLTIDELAALAEKYGMAERDVAQAEQIWTYMRDAITSLENVRIKQLQNMVAKEQLSREDFALQLKDMKRDFDALRNRNYMPHTRFGRYVLHGKAMEKNLKVDEYYSTKRIGETAIFETFQNEKAMLEALRDYENTWGSRVQFETNLVEDDLQQMFIGFDPTLAKQIINGLGMDEKQALELTTLMTKLSPSEGFRKRLVERKGIPGYSTQTVKVFADYGARFGNFVSRMETVDDMKEAIEEMKAASRNIAGVEGVKRSQVINWVERHMQYMMNPGNELAALRAAGFLWYIGLVPKSAVVNMTQVPLVAYPYLAARFKSDASAVKELSKAMAKVSMVHKGSARYTAEQQQMFEDLKHLMDESFASMLGGLQEGSILERMTSGRIVGDERVALAIHEFQHIAGFMFSAAEMYNRRIVGLAAYELAKKQGRSHDDAVMEARLALERTQFEYARFNRPELMRGKKSAFFLFQQYTLNMLQFLARDGGGRGRYLLMMLLIGGLQGVPFGDTIIDFVDMFLTKYKEMMGGKEPKTQMRKEIRELLTGLAEESPYIPDMSDVVVRGLAANLGPYDVSGSIGFGRPIPGTDSIAREGMTPKEKLGAMVGDLAGPLAAVPIAAVSAMGSDDPDVWRRWEKVMPTAIAGVSKARRFWANEAETDYYGDTTITFDRKNPSHIVEIVGQAAGFAPSRLTETRQKDWMAKEAIKYYEGRKSVVLKTLEAAVRHQDGDELRLALDAISEYNDSVPHGSFKISPEGARQSVKQKLTRSQLVRMGYGRDRQFAPFYKEYINAITLPERINPEGPATVEEPNFRR